MLDRVSPQATIGLDCLSKMIGNTPLFRIDLRCQGRDITVYAKAEMYNLSGSIKDRMALMIVQRAMERGELEMGQSIVEATSGSSGIALAAVGGAVGCPVKIYMPDWMSAERKALLKSYGAQLELVSHEDGGFLGAIAMAKEYARSNGAFLSRQFASGDNCLAHFLGTGPELARQVQADKGEIGAFVAGVGTGGTIMGVGQFLKTCDPSIAAHPIEPAESPILTNGKKTRSHRIQGLSGDFIPEIIEFDQIDSAIAVNDGDAILMAQKLCSEAGLGVGISSGANLVGAVKAALGREDGKAMATVFCDANVRYISTDLTKVEKVQEGYLAPQIELRAVKVIGAA